MSFLTGLIHLNQLTLLLLAVCLSSFLGCSRCGGFLGIDKCADIPSGAIPEPVGNKLLEWQAAQASLALQDQTTFYKADFVGSSEKLSPAAINKIYRALNNGLENRHWLVEPSGDTALDEVRLARVLATLEANGAENPSLQMAIPRAIGLPGVFAESSIRNSGLGGTGGGNGIQQSFGFSR